MPSERTLFARARLEMDLAAAGLSSATFLGRYSHRDARPALAEHSHGEAFEICYLVKGRQTYRVGGRDYHLRGGDVFMTFPHERHSSGGAPQEKGVLYWLVLPTSRSGARLPRSSLGLDTALRRAIGHLPTRHFPGSWRMKESFDILTAAFHGSDPLREVTMQHAVTGFLLELVACGTAMKRPERSSLTTVLRHIASHLDEPASVPQLAQIAGLSTSRFKARFKEELGVPPAEYHLRARVEEARRRLVARAGSVTDIAFDLGFSSSQYFATVFKRFTGLNPGGLIR